MMGLLVLIIFILLIGGGIWGWPVIAGILGLSSVNNKEGALKYIAQLMNTYDISLDEIKHAQTQPQVSGPTAGSRSKGDIARTLFIWLGAIFIFSGIAIYIGMHWEKMGSALRVAVSLGIGYLLFVVLISALHENKYPKLIFPMCIASVVMMSSGWFVFLHEYFSEARNWQAAVLFVFGTMAIHQAGLLVKYRQTIIAFWALFFVYGFLHTALDMAGLSLNLIAIILGASLFLVSTAMEKTSFKALCEVGLFLALIWLYSGMTDLLAKTATPNIAGTLVGLCAMGSAYGFHLAGRYPRLIAIGYFVGSAMFYSALFDMLQGSPLELLFLAMTAAALYLCVIIQSRALLTTTVLALLGFIGYFSAEYFSDSLGWPLTLMVMGVAFLAVGTLAVKVKRKI